jgi:hypothetical protein
MVFMGGLSASADSPGATPAPMPRQEPRERPARRVQVAARVTGGTRAFT